jgi:hypothetical protein
MNMILGGPNPHSLLFKVPIGMHRHLSVIAKKVFSGSKLIILSKKVSGVWSRRAVGCNGLGLDCPSLQLTDAETFT